MTIGEALKQERLKLGLTQTQMAGNVLTKSYYSKVERGLHEINAIDLLDILDEHDIDSVEFFNKIRQFRDEKEIRIKKYNRLFHVAYYNKDLEMLNQFAQKLEKEDQTNEIFVLEAQIALLKASIKKDFSIISKSEVKRIKNLIFATENWNENNLRLFSMSMQLFKIEEAGSIANSIFNKFKNINNLPNDLKEIVLAIAVNYLEYAHYCDCKENKYIEKAIKLLQSLTPEPKNCFAKIMEFYYQDVFKGNKESSRKILKFLSDSGMSTIVSKMKR